MGEIQVFDQIGNRPRIREEFLDEPVTTDQRDSLVAAIDSKNVNDPTDVIVHHEHRSRATTTINTATTKYWPNDFYAEISRNGNMRVLKIATVQPFDNTTNVNTERFYEVNPGVPDDDYYDELSIYVDKTSGKQVNTPFETELALLPELVDEQTALNEKLGINNLTQGRWQEAMDALDLCKRRNMIRENPSKLGRLVVKALSILKLNRF